MRYATLSGQKCHHASTSFLAPLKNDMPGEVDLVKSELYYHRRPLHVAPYPTSSHPPESQTWDSGSNPRRGLTCIVPGIVVSHHFYPVANYAPVPPSEAVGALPR